MKRNFKDLVELASYLRSPDGCPWDREQNLQSLKAYIIEEAFESVEAIETENTDHIVEELGDLFYQVIFASQISSEDNRFNIDDVINAMYNKLVRRHPHVFGENKAKNAGEALKRWHTVKEKENNREKSLLDIPRGMPALLRAQRVGEKASGVGFDWNKISDVIEKLEEELDELKTAISENNKSEIENEWGDLVFSIVNLARHLKIDAETTAHKSINKFAERFSQVEAMAAQQNKKLSDMTIREMDKIWNEIK